MREYAVPRKSTPPASVDTFLATLDHPFKPVIEALRATILAVDPAIHESIKWNAPSFATTEHFATMQLRAKDGVQLILHRGAKKRDDPSAAIADPTHLLEWLADDRASLELTSLADLTSKRPAFIALVRQWLTQV